MRPGETERRESAAPLRGNGPAPFRGGGKRAQAHSLGQLELYSFIGGTS